MMLTNADGLRAVEAMPMEQYLNTHFRPDRDYIDGAARERNVGFRPHSEVLGIVGAMLLKMARANGMIALMSIRMRVDERTVMVPDLALIPQTQRNENVLVTPPLLCVEIAEPRDTMLGLLQRVAKYSAMGVKNVWVIDPETRAGYCGYSNGLEMSLSGLMKVRGTEVVLSLADAFAEVD